MIGEIQKREFDPKVDSAKIAGNLRKLADQIEAEATTSFSRIDIGHYLPVTSFNGGMVTDQQFLGWTMVISTMSIPRDVTDNIRKIVEGQSVPFEVRLPSKPASPSISLGQLPKVRFEAMNLVQLRAYRDDINAIIFDKERAQ